MIHATGFRHVLDKLVTTMGCKIATEIWCDSEASKRFAQRRFSRPAEIISFLIATSVPPGEVIQRKPLDFVYWGRHAHVKNVPRAVRLFNRILSVRPNARLFIYGGDGPSTEDIREAIGEADSPGSITLMGPKPPGEYPDPIPSCTFFLMTSRQEGMAVAVVEAMQLGLIPVVSPVGEIESYCHADNAIIVADDEQAALDVVRVASDDVERSKLSAGAVEQWVNRSDYSTDFQLAYERLLTLRKSSPQSLSDE